MSCKQHSTMFAAALGVVLLAMPPAESQPPAQMSRPFRILTEDPGLDRLIVPDAELELVGDRFGLTEGPVWMPDEGEGLLLFSDLISNVIYRWAPGEPITVYLEQRGYSGDAATAISRGALVGQDAAGSRTALIWATYIDELVRTEAGREILRREIVGDIPGPENGAR